MTREDVFYIDRLRIDEVKHLNKCLTERTISVNCKRFIATVYSLRSSRQFTRQRFASSWKEGRGGYQTWGVGTKITFIVNSIKFVWTNWYELVQNGGTQLTIRGRGTTWSAVCKTTHQWKLGNFEDVDEKCAIKRAPPPRKLIGFNSLVYSERLSVFSSWTNNKGVCNMIRTRPSFHSLPFGYYLNQHTWNLKDKLSRPFRENGEKTLAFTFKMADNRL